MSTCFGVNFTQWFTRCCWYCVRSEQTIYTFRCWSNKLIASPSNNKQTNYVIKYRQSMLRCWRRFIGSRKTPLSCSIQHCAPCTRYINLYWKVYLWFINKHQHSSTREMGKVFIEWRSEQVDKRRKDEISHDLCRYVVVTIKIQSGSAAVLVVVWI